MLPLHPLCAVYPDMPEDEYAELVEDIRRHGLKQPIVTYQGQIVDGKHRYRACEQLGIPPQTQEWDGTGSLVDFVVSANSKRRHLTASQRAAIAVELLPFYEAEARKRQATSSGGPTPQLVTKLSQAEKGKAREKAAQQTKASPVYVSEAKRIKQEAPEKFEQVKLGHKTISQVKKELRLEQAKQKERQALLAVPTTELLWTVTDCQEVVPCKAVITDPPYGVLDEPWEPKDLHEFTADWLSRWNQCGADFIVSFWSQVHLWDGRRWFDEYLSNYRFQQLLIWHYRNNVSPYGREGFKRTWEPIFFYRRIDSSTAVKSSDGQWGGDLHDLDCHVAAVPQSNFDGQEMKQHPAQKPVSVFRWLINALTQPGEMVCDPFCGSGTCGIAATQLSRRFHGIEIHPEYVQLAKQRIATYGKPT